MPYYIKTDEGQRTRRRQDADEGSQMGDEGKASFRMPGETEAKPIWQDKEVHRKPSKDGGRKDGKTKTAKTPEYIQ